VRERRTRAEQREESGEKRATGSLIWIP
jgi:hypothetical protein